MHPSELAWHSSALLSWANQEYPGRGEEPKVIKDYTDIANVSSPNPISHKSNLFASL